MMVHMAAFLGGFLVDLLLGDPYSIPHPIRWIGRMIAALEQWFLGNQKERRQEQISEQKQERELRRGAVLVILVAGSTVLCAAAVFALTVRIHPALRFLAEVIMTWQLLAARCLNVESMKVYRCLKTEDLEASRKAVSMIVGRDTRYLDEAGVARAAIETVAENTSDGVIAPMLYTALGGPVLGFFYKAVNTMDSMVGYKNDTYLYFGRAAAKLDDAVNYLPSRISAGLMIAAAFFCGIFDSKHYSGTGAAAVWRRDRKKHASPNSAQTESVCAGALGLRLAGDAVYFGNVVKKPYIGDALRPVEAEDIRRANRLMYLTAWMCEIFCLLLMAVTASAF